jgi:hypothetical protein
MDDDGGELMNRPATSSWRLPTSVRVGLTAVLCVVAWIWLARKVDLAALHVPVARVPAWAWAAAGLGLLAGHGVRALRLQREWRHVRHVPWWDCLRLVLGHNALVLLLPLRTGEAGYVWAVRRHWGVGWGTAALALLRWRLQDATVLALLALLLWLPATPAVRIASVVLAALVLHLAMPPLWRWLAARVGSGMEATLRGGPWAGLGASIALWTLKVVASGGLLALLAGLPLARAWRAALGGELGGVQPLQPPAGLGPYEAGVWLAAGLPASQSSAVVTAALAVHAFSLAVALGAAALAQLAPVREHEEPSRP